MAGPLLMCVVLSQRSDTPPGYTAAMLTCGAFRQVIQADIRSALGATMRMEASRREGRLQLQATPTDSGIAVEAWYDSLAISRTTRDGTERADTDGLIGGRWHAMLAADGRLRRVETPFVPPEVADLADMQPALDEFLPRFVPVAVDSAFRVDRLTDSAGLARWHWEARRHGTQEIEAGPGFVAVGRVTSREEGQVAWHPRTGPMRWSRHVHAETEILPGGAVKVRFRSIVEQDERVERVACIATR